MKNVVHVAQDGIVDLVKYTCRRFIHFCKHKAFSQSYQEIYDGEIERASARLVAHREWANEQGISPRSSAYGDLWNFLPWHHEMHWQLPKWRG